MKVKKSDINLLIMLIGVLLAVVAYFIVYQQYTEKTASIEADNAVLEEEVRGLQELADNKDFYISETARMETEIADIMSRYPSEVRTEDQVMYTVKLENEHSIWVNSLSVEDTQLVQVAAPTAAPAADSVVEEGAEGDAVQASGALSDTVFLYTSPFSISYKTTYRSAKDIIASIVTSDERMNISNISLAYDAETGCLSGTMDATMFTMSGTDAMYEELNVPGVPTGTADFFKSGVVLNLNTNANAVDESGESEDEESEESDEATSEE